LGFTFGLNIDVLPGVLVRILHHRYNKGVAYSAEGKAVRETPERGRTPWCAPADGLSLRRGGESSQGPRVMLTTSVSLLERLRDPGEQQAWAWFVKLYTPLLYHWARRSGLQDQDAADLLQDVFTILVQKLPEFTYNPHQSFRGWLRTILLNRWRNFLRQRTARPLEGRDDPLPEPAGPDVADVLAEAEYRQRLVERALQLMQTDFQPTTWKAFQECQVAGRPAADVAAELGISAGAVYVAKSRVLARLRQELEGLLD
jgi:RNA polymerase sigma-70 factor (ECF subfamily)